MVIILIRVFFKNEVVQHMSGEDRYMWVMVSVRGRVVWGAKPPKVWDFTELYVLRLYLKTPFVIQ